MCPRSLLFIASHQRILQGLLERYWYEMDANLDAQTKGKCNTCKWHYKQHFVTQMIITWFGKTVVVVVWQSSLQVFQDAVKFAIEHVYLDF